MDYFAQQLINGLVVGSIYGLIAIGYTMVYGIVGMINFAHGDVFMIGGFMALISFLVLVSFGLALRFSAVGMWFVCSHYSQVPHGARVTPIMPIITGGYTLHEGAGGFV